MQISRDTFADQLANYSSLIFAVNVLISQFWIFIDEHTSIPIQLQTHWAIYISK